ncbi:MAG: DUF4351 domain-containing protein, partial [Burkholderiaceae bacterium]
MNNDIPWKEAIDGLFVEFIGFFFPQAAADIDWARGVEFLDQELPPVLGDDLNGLLRVDKLAKVFRRSGMPLVVFVHVEVQAQRDADFERRMFTYHYRIHDRFIKKDEAHQVVSFAVLADAAAHWRPNCFGYSLWGFSLQMNFPSVKLLDWRGREAKLEAASNPFAAIVLAHLQAVATKNDPRTRFNVTLSYCKALFRKGYSS